MKKRSYLNTFNLYNASAGKENQPKYWPTQAKNNMNKVIELHFINPNLLFLNLPSKPSRPHTKQSSLHKIQSSRKQNRISTCPVGARSVGRASQKGERKTEQTLEGKMVRKRLDDYIKMQRLYLHFRKTGSF